MVAACLPGALGAALRLLAHAPDVQFAFLRALLGDGGAAGRGGGQEEGGGLAPLLQGVPPAEADAVSEAYLALLCRYDRKAVRPFLARSCQCRLQAAIALVAAAGVEDAHALLLERSGRASDALAILLAHLAAATAAMRAALRACDDARGSAREQQAAERAFEARSAAAAAMEDAIGLCARNSPDAVDVSEEEEQGAIARALQLPSIASGGGGGELLDSPHSLWFTLLDASLAGARTAPGGAPPCGTERAALSASLERLLLALRACVPPAAVAARLVRPGSAQGPDALAAMRGPLVGTLRAAAAEEALLGAAVAAISSDAASRGAAALAASRRALPSQGVTLSEPPVRAVAVTTAGGSGSAHQLTA